MYCPFRYIKLQVWTENEIWKKKKRVYVLTYNILNKERISWFLIQFYTLKLYTKFEISKLLQLKK
jgi:hypothetical protein